MEGQAKWVLATRWALVPMMCSSSRLREAACLRPLAMLETLASTTIAARARSSAPSGSASRVNKHALPAAAAANTDGAAVEQSFVTQVEALPPQSRGKLQELLVAFAGSELFVRRGAQ